MKSFSSETSIKRVFDRSWLGFRFLPEVGTGRGGLEGAEACLSAGGRVAVAGCVLGWWSLKWGWVTEPERTDGSGSREAYFPGRKASLLFLSSPARERLGGSVGPRRP